MVICYLGIGSNLGNRRKNISLAIKKVNALSDTKVIKASGIIEGEPVGGPAGQGKFLNAALKIKTRLSPSALLKKLKTIEKELGRVPALRWGERIIDLDILLYANKAINQRNLKIPHPRLYEREFAMKPLLEII